MRGRGRAVGDFRDRGWIDEEIRFHLEGRAEELMAQGLSREEAERRAEAAFGDVERVRSELMAIEARRSRRERLIEGLGAWGRDVRNGIRRLRRSPGHAAVAVWTLALGMGATVAMFTVLNGVVLRPLPYAEPDRLVRVWPAANYNIALSREVGRSLPSVTSWSGISHWGLTLTGEGEAVVLNAAVVDAGYFEVFGVRPVVGRAFVAGETEPATSGVVLLSDATWRGRFGGDPGVIGRRIRLAGYDHEIREVIGVMPAGHRPPREAVDAWIPLHVPAGRTISSDSTWYVNEVVARLAPGSAVVRADAELKSVVAGLRAGHPGLIDEDVARAATVVGLKDAMVGDVSGLLWTLLAAVGLVLLIACGNLANLLLARATRQRREFAVQAALGASRWRLIRQQLAESGVVALIGGLLGLLLARVLLDSVRVSDASGLPRVGDLALDGTVFAFAAIATAGALLAFGLLPAVRATGGRVGDDLRSGTRGGSRARDAHRLNRGLVAAQLAMATVLTTAAGLVLASFIGLRSVDPGIDTRDVLAVQVLPPANPYNGDRLVQFYEEVEARLTAMPGVTAVGAIHLLPFTSGNWSFPYLAQGHAPPENGPLPSANFRMVTPGYFEAVDQPLLAGRGFSAEDRAGSPRVVLVNERMARSLWPGEDPLGREIRIFGSMAHRVVGVTGDVRQHTLDREPFPEMYVPLAQWTNGGATLSFMVESADAGGQALRAREILASVDPDAPVTDIRPLEDVVGDSVAQRRFIALVLAAFGMLALCLGAVGVYGVTSHLVGARLPDYGVRMALGARPGDVMRDALRAGLLPGIAGLAVGLLGATATTGLLRRWLFGVSPLHLPAYTGTALVLLAITGVASWLPARRAARADPLKVLRSD